MTWWQTLVVASVPALVTLIGLMIQLRITNAAQERRSADERAEREHDRKHAAEEAEKERRHQQQLIADAHDAELSRQQSATDIQRRHQLEDLWREERRVAHAGALAEAEELVRQMRDSKTGMRFDDHGKPAPDQEFARDWSRIRVSDAITSVEMVAGEESRAAAERVRTRLFNAHLLFLGAEVGALDVTRESLNNAVRELSEAISVYKQAVRAELGST